MKNALWIGSVLALSLAFVTGCRSADSEPLDWRTQGPIASGEDQPIVDHSEPLDPGPIQDALNWLAAHQSEDGRWDADGFGDECAKAGEEICESPGSVQYDVAATGLALLAFYGAGQTCDVGAYKDHLEAGVWWLREQQDRETGLIGLPASHDFLYGHAIATYALCEVYNVSKSPLLKRNCRLAVDYVVKARNPYGAWRYDVPPVGDNDTSVTGWMMLALKSAERAGLAVEQDAFEGAHSWIDMVTDPETGRVGYSEVGSRSARIPGINEHYPADSGEAMTAIGLSIRVALGETDPTKYPSLQKGGDLILRSLPAWDDHQFTSDMYYWYHATRAMNELGGTYAEKWNAAMDGAGQRAYDHAKGSWDPIGPWGYAGGRVYSTALMAMCLSLQPTEPAIEAPTGLGYL